MDDSISRKAAIRWVKTECNPYGNPTLDFESGKKVIEHLEQMPSAQPEILTCGEGELNIPDTNVGDCSDCIKHGGDWDCDYVHCHKGESAQPERKNSEWMMHSDYPDCLICSKCGAQFDVWHWESKQMHFCPNCGAKME